MDLNEMSAKYVIACEKYARKLERSWHSARPVQYSTSDLWSLLSHAALLIEILMLWTIPTQPVWLLYYTIELSCSATAPCICTQSKVYTVTVLYFYNSKFPPPEHYMLHTSRFVRSRFVEGCIVLQRTLRQSERLSRGVPAKPARSAGNTFRFAICMLHVPVNLSKFISQRGCYTFQPLAYKSTVNHSQ